MVLHIDIDEVGPGRGGGLAAFEGQVLRGVVVNRLVLREQLDRPVDPWHLILPANVARRQCSRVRETLQGTGDRGAAKEPPPQPSPVRGRGGASRPLRARAVRQRAVIGFRACSVAVSTRTASSNCVPGRQNVCWRCQNVCCAKLAGRLTRRGRRETLGSNRQKQGVRAKIGCFEVENGVWETVCWSWPGRPPLVRILLGPMCGDTMRRGARRSGEAQLGAASWVRRGKPRPYRRVRLLRPGPRGPTLAPCSGRRAGSPGTPRSRPRV